MLGMAGEIRIDIERYYRRHGKRPSGRGYWAFQLVSAIATAKDHIRAPQEEMPFKAACEVATLRRAKMIVLLPE
ncbi:hypothetical protein [Bradyrhizobium sp. WSM1417]|uniref:hypothetical protein n=1 Tax=Bradyrhizobium sp. WSM1417 TaxID=754500 RepID=UPI00048227F3|nr:hypothetical protein [Bradyrhizobium sp. WSM1417]